MRYQVETSTTINSAHQLPGTDLHGHSYRVTAIVEGELNPDGLVVRLEELRQSLLTAAATVDHCLLEKVIGSPATAERLAFMLAWSVSVELKRPVRMRVAIGDDGVVEMLEPVCAVTE